MSGFQDTMLDSILRNLGVTSLLFAGVNADQCVLCTLQDANFLGYDCLLIEDCTATTSPEYCMAGDDLQCPPVLWLRHLLRRDRRCTCVTFAVRALGLSLCCRHETRASSAAAS